jgi:hypothetical protein
MVNIENNFQRIFGPPANKHSQLFEKSKQRATPSVPDASESIISKFKVFVVSAFHLSSGENILFLEWFLGKESKSVP